MMRLNAKFFAFIVVAIGNVIADDRGTRQCPGGYNDGTQMDIGRYWYECRDGQVIPKGCVTEDGRRVSIDETFDTREYRMKCVRNGDSFLTAVYVGCMHQGSGRDVGSQWDDGTTFYTCVREGKNVHVVTLGCIDQGRPVKLDERVAKGDFIYQCNGGSFGTPRMNKVGCVFEGRKYNIGETFDGRHVWYSCTDSGAQIVGCIHDSRRLQDGDFFNENDIRYSCKLNGENTKFEAFGCIANDDGAKTEKAIGCVWVEGNGAYAYEYTCKEDDVGKLAKVQTQCAYRPPGRGAFKVEPGCVRLSPVGAVGCSQDGPGKLTMQVYSRDQVDSLPGLRRC